MNEFPIRCHIWTTRTKIHCGKAATMAVTCTTASCPCPPRDVTICADHEGAWAQVGRVVLRKRCLACGTTTNYSITATRALHEGDLPDPETVAAARSATKEPLERGDG